MSLSDWNAILEDLTSQRPKERSEAVSRYQQFLSSTRNFRSLSKIAESDDSFWLKGLQPLFAVVKIEYTHAARKPTPAADTRLSDSVNLIKWTVEKLNLQLNKKSLKAVVAHLLDMCCIGGKLPVFSLAYVKALHAILSYAPHLNHLDEQRWYDVVNLCFSGILGAKIKIRKSILEDSAMGVDPDDDGFEQSRADETVRNTEARKPATVTEIELAACLECALRSKTAPFTTCSYFIFRKFHRVFQKFPHETGAHLSALTALNHAFAELDLNDQKAMTDIGSLLWPSILALWTTKNAALKEQVLISLHYLLPFVAVNKDGIDIASVVLKPLLDAVLSEPSLRWRDTFDLNIENLFFRLSRRNTTSGINKAFSMPTFRLGNGFTAKNAVAWSLLELGSECLAYSDAYQKQLPSPPDQYEGAARKRRKIDHSIYPHEVISNFLDSFNNSREVSHPSLVMRVQIVLFLVERHWHALQLGHRHNIVANLDQLLTNDSRNVQEWVLAAFAAISVVDKSSFDVQEVAKLTQKQYATPKEFWTPIWQFALRRISDPVLGRISAHVVEALLDGQDIDPSLRISSIEMIASELHFQGPTFPFDTVCSLLKKCISIAANDIHLFRSGFKEKVFDWILRIPSPLDAIAQTHSIGHKEGPFSLETFAALILSLCDLPDYPLSTSNPLIPDCPIATMVCNMEETKIIRDFIKGRMPEKGEIGGQDHNQDGAVHMHSGAKSVLVRRVSSWLEKQLTDLLAAGENVENYWTSMTIDSARRHLDCMTISLLLAASLEIQEGKGCNISTMTRKACSLAIFVAPCLSLQKWTTVQRAFLLQSLHVIMVTMPEQWTVSFTVLLEPGSASGIPHRFSELHRENTVSQVSSESMEALTHRIWANIKETKSDGALLDAMHSALRTSSGLSRSTELNEIDTLPQQDEFDLQFPSTSRQNQTFSDRASSLSVSLCIRCLLSIELPKSHTAISLESSDIAHLILSSDELSIALIGEQAFKAVQGGFMRFSLSDAQSLLRHLGGNILPDYRYDRDERFALLALKFLECTAPLWINASSESDNKFFSLQANSLCAHFAQAFHRGKLSSWRVRLQWNSFLHTYLTFDPDQEHWNHDDMGCAPEGYPQPVLPINMIPRGLGDADFRVRFFAAASTSRLFTLLDKRPELSNLLFREVQGVLDNNLDNFETILTQILALANIMVASAYRRRSPFLKLYNTVFLAPRYSSYVESVLKETSQKLRLSGLSELYEVYSRYIASNNRTKDGIGRRVALSITGRVTIHDMLVADLQETGCLLLQSQDDEEAFTLVCEGLGMSRQKCVLLCIPDSVALALKIRVEQQVPSELLKFAAFQPFVDWLATQGGCEDDSEINDLMMSFADETVACLLSYLYEPTWKAGELHLALSEKQETAIVFRSILGLSEDLHMIEPNPPYGSSNTIVKACILFDEKYPIFSRPSSFYGLIQNLLARVDRAPFVDLQKKQMVCLAMGIALGHRQISQDSILSMVCGGLISLIQNVELSDIVQAFLRWCYTQWKELLMRSRKGHEAFCQSVLSAAHAYHVVADQSSGNLGLADKLFSMKTFLEECLNAQSQDVSTRYFLLWPYDVPSLRHTTILPELEQALLHSTTTTNRSWLARRLREYKGSLGACDPDRIGRLLWHLAKFLSHATRPLAEDCEIMAELLYISNGKIIAPGLADGGRQAAHQQGSNLWAKKSLSRESADSASSIVAAVFDLLHQGDQLLTYEAYRTLRLVFSSSSKGLIDRHLPTIDRATMTLIAADGVQQYRMIRAYQSESLDKLRLPQWSKIQPFMTWISKFTELLALVCSEGEPMYAQLLPLLRLNSGFSVKVIPFLVHSVLLISASSESASYCISNYLEAQLNLQGITNQHRRAITDLALHLRTYVHPKFANSFYSGDKWLSTSWLSLAKSAATSADFYASLLFLELSHEDVKLTAYMAGDDDVNEMEQSVQSILYDIYAHIDEPDGFYGRQSGNTTDALVRRYCHEGRWDAALAIYAAEYESNFPPDVKNEFRSSSGVAQSLASIGLHRVAMHLMPSEKQWDTTDSKSSLSYESAWRTAVWDLPVLEMPNEHEASSYNLYSMLRLSQASRRHENIATGLDTFFSDEVKRLTAIRFKDLATPNADRLCTLLALHEVRKWSRARETTLSMEELSSSLTLLDGFAFNHVERILSARVSVWRSICAREKEDQIGDTSSAKYEYASAATTFTLLELSRRARLAGMLQISVNAVTFAKRLSPDKSLEIDKEFAHVLWAQKEYGTAIALLEKNQLSITSSSTLAQLGEWTSLARLKSPQEISQVFFEPAIASLSETHSPEERATVHSLYASYADLQYEELVLDVQTKRRNYESYRQRKNLEWSEIGRKLNDMDSTAISQYERSKKAGSISLKEDEQVLKEAQETMKRMLRHSVVHYGSAMMDSDKHDDKIFRLCALWQSNSNDDELQKDTLQPLLDQNGIASHKFVFLAYQLSSRLSKQHVASPFLKNINRIVYRICKDHPFHALYSVLGLREGGETPSSSSSPSSLSARRQLSTPVESSSRTKRAAAAGDVVEKLKKHSKLLRSRVEALELACEAYREWAAFDLKKASQTYYVNKSIRRGELPVHLGAKIVTRLRDLPIPVSTVDLPVDRTCEYGSDQIPLIIRYGETFTTAGGVNVPKVMTCWASDGHKYIQLLKGGDDIRQDAVMEQAFSLISDLLRRDHKTHIRNLQLRTYKVIPLPGQTGIIEFVADTTSLNELWTPLYEKTEAKQGMSPKEARAALQHTEAQKKASALPLHKMNQKKEQVFKTILTRLKPVMRHFFFEKHKIPSLWFAMRLNFTRSVAASSIVGHIVGLGDRHGSNILMDKIRGEIVQIDLGIAFEQGRRLPMPETVPFRLTQNIVDGFGMTGVEGVFRRGAEETLRVLRDRSDLIMTVLKVFKHDPLQTWSLSADLIRRAQGDSELDQAVEELPDDADRALDIVEAKLGNKLSVEHTINQLIREATDPILLSHLFSGWQPYL